MIYTCTINPSLDYYMEFSEVKLSEKNRCLNESYKAGGKGLNISIMLNRLEIPSIALGFLGGFVRDYYLSFLKEYTYIQPLFTSIRENSRINVRILEKEETSYNARGPKISEEEFAVFRKRFNNLYHNDIFALSGYVQEEMRDKMADIVSALTREGVKVVIDSTRSVVDACIGSHPLLVRVDQNISDDPYAYAEELVKQGVQNVLISADNHLSLLNEKGRWDCENEISMNSYVGTADSIIAAYLYACIRGASPLESFRYACAAGLYPFKDGDARETLQQRLQEVKVVER